MARQNVLFIVPTLRRAGAECQLVSLVNGLASDTVVKHLLFYAPGNDLKADVDQRQVELHELQRRHKLDISLGRQIGKIIDENSIDIVHCTLLNALIYGSLGAYFAKRNPRLVSVIHTTKNAGIRLDIADFLVHRRLLKRCDQIWFVSSNQADLWTRKLPFIKGKQQVVHNGIETAHFDPAQFSAARWKMREKLGIAHHERVLCSVAALRPEKLHLVLIESLNQVISDGTRCRLLLAGVGPMEGAIRAKIVELGLQEHVAFLGSLSDVRPLLAASDCKVLVSAAETFSMAMLEAMAMEVPVITTPIGGAGEAIDDGKSGFLVRPRDVRQLAGTIAEILSDDERRLQMGRRAREVVVDKFSIEKMIDKSADLLLEIAARP